MLKTKFIISYYKLQYHTLYLSIQVSSMSPLSAYIPSPSVILCTQLPWWVLSFWCSLYSWNPTHFTNPHLTSQGASQYIYLFYQLQIQLLSHLLGHGTAFWWARRMNQHSTYRESTAWSPKVLGQVSPLTASSLDVTIYGLKKHLTGKFGRWSEIMYRKT